MKLNMTDNNSIACECSFRHKKRPAPHRAGTFFRDRGGYIPFAARQPIALPNKKV